MSSQSHAGWKPLLAQQINGQAERTDKPMTTGQTDLLRVTVGEPTFLSAERYQNRATVAVSRTGVVAAFYQKPGTGPKFYRISTDGARTWGEEREFPPMSACPMSVGLRGGGVLFMSGSAVPVKGGKRDDLEASRIVFSDDFKSHESGISAVSIPRAVMHTVWAKFWPPFDKGKIVQLTNGDLMATLYGNLEEDTQTASNYRTMIVRSTDSGRTWRYHASVAFGPNDPDPRLVGAYCGYCEPSLALLPDGRLLCVMRTQGAQYTGEYRPLYVSWSEDMGKTWTRPVPTKPHLMNISPTLAVLDNGVVACQYGRPGFHVAFSIDNGHTWRDRVSFSDLHEPLITGQFDMVKVGPNRLAAIGNDAGGTKVWPIEVERVKASPTQTALTGRVLDPASQPIVGAKVELGPNRYEADSWREGEEFNPGSQAREVVSPPVLGYRSIAKEKGYPIAKTDARGQFEFGNVNLCEYVLTVEAEGHAPQWRHINAGAEPQTHEQQFQLKAGRSIRGRVADQNGKPVGGACVVLDKCHIHADPDGYFSWAVDAPVPEEVTVTVYKRYSGEGTFGLVAFQSGAPGTFEGRLSVARIANEPIILRRTN